VPIAAKVADGTRTHDHLDHNQGLYQLSYSHRAPERIAARLRQLLPAKSAQHFLRLNQGLYQLSYSHRALRRIAARLRNLSPWLVSGEWRLVQALAQFGHGLEDRERSSLS
jgi:metal-dependent hydrolase (beta-lactamase superfamily II)